MSSLVLPNSLPGGRVLQHGTNFGRTGRFSLRTTAPTSAGSSRMIHGPLGRMTHYSEKAMFTSDRADRERPTRLAPPVRPGQSRWHCVHLERNGVKRECGDSPHVSIGRPDRREREGARRLSPEIRSQASPQLAFRRASSTASGCRAITASNTRAGPSGRVRPCSQLRKVAGWNPNRFANSD